MDGLLFVALIVLVLALISRPAAPTPPPQIILLQSIPEAPASRSPGCLLIIFAILALLALFASFPWAL